MSEPASVAYKLRAAATGHPHAKIPWPHRLLHEAADHITGMETRIAELEAAVLREKCRVDSLHQCINERDAHLAEAREALKEIETADGWHAHEVVYRVRGIAKRALAGQGGEG